MSNERMKAKAFFLHFTVWIMILAVGITVSAATFAGLIR